MTDLVEAPETSSERQDYPFINQMHCFKIFMMCVDFMGCDLTHHTTIRVEMFIWVVNSDISATRIPKQLQQSF